MPGIQGYDPMGGLGAGGGGSPDGWVNLSALIDTSLAPVLDPNAQWVGGTSDATGTSVTVNDTHAYVTSTACVALYVGTMAALLPGLPASDYILQLRFTQTTAAPQFSGLWCGISWGTGNPPNATTLGHTVGDNGGPGVRFYGILTSSTFVYKAAAGATPEVWTMVSAKGDAGVASLNAGATAFTCCFGTPGPTHVFLECGCVVAGGTGPHTMAGLWEIRAIR